MFYIEVHEFIHRIVEIFYRSRMWRRGEEDSHPAWKLFYLILYLSFFMSLVLGGLFSDDWSESTFLISLSVAVLVITAKLTCILWKKGEIRKFIDDIGTHSVADYEEFTKANCKVKNLMKFSTIFFSTSFFNCLVFITITPVFSNEKSLPISIWFPFDWKNNLIFYCIAYAFVFIGIVISCITLLITVMIWYLLMSCAIKYQILGNHFRNMFLTQPTIQNRNISDREQENLFLQELIFLVEIHRKIKKTIDRVKSTFGNLFFLQITTSGIGICGSVYALAFDPHDGISIQFVIQSVLMLYSIFDIFMVMYLGNEIKVLSDRLSYCLFDSNWLERSKLCKKFIIILTEVLKRPQELTIGKLYPLNMDTFKSIVYSAYSMFNVLRNLN